MNKKFKPTKDTETEKTITRNKKAFHSYFVDESHEAGVVLLGTEVKSLREGRVQLVDAYARFDRGELWLLNAHIAPYRHGTHENHDPMRPRKLLLKRRELRRLQAKSEAAGCTLIPLRIYFKDSRVKVEVGLCRGKKLFDKRESLRKREASREMARRHAQHHQLRGNS